MTSSLNNTPLLLLLDGILSQDEQSTSIALEQIKKLDPSLASITTSGSENEKDDSDDNDDNLDDSPASSSSSSLSPLRSASVLEDIVGRLLGIQPHLARIPSENDGSLPLHFAASIGNIRVTALLLHHYRDAALMHNTKGKIPLHYAAREGRTDMVRFLLRLVPSCASVSTKKSKLALHFAAGEGHTDVVRDLLRVYPESAKIPSKKGKVGLHFAARWGHIDIARDLYQIYPDCIHTLDYDGSNPLHDATREGQFEMSKFLVERYPPALCKSNIRGEIPLFAAIRSGNVPLCAFLIRSWPASGKQVLQETVSDPTDDVSSWEPDILNLCLRGAVGNFSDLSTEECANYNIDDHANAIISNINSSNMFTTINGDNGNILIPNTSTTASSTSAEQPGGTTTRIGRVVQAGIGGCYLMNGNFINRSVIQVPPYSSSSSIEIWNGNYQNEVRHLGFVAIGVAAATTPRAPTGRFAADVTSRHRHNNNGGNYTTSYCSPQRLPLNISLPRSKSPILEIDDCGSKKRSASDGTNDNKRQCRGSIDENEEDNKGQEDCCDATKKMRCYGDALEKHTFYQVHAALECSATTNILKCVLERYPEQHTVVDDYGRLPLHLAVSHCRSEGSVDLILEQIWKPNQDACHHRDYFGRLPIHLALMNNADSRFVKVLLDANPSSGVEQCQIVDERFAHDLPIHMATSHGCNLSTIFMLIRGDPTMVQSWKSC
jgi:ankyrin repeat protein